MLGAHNLESAESRLVSLLVDGVLALDAGALTSGLTFAEQRRVQAILLTHHHFDHIRDLATFGLTAMGQRSIDLYATEETLAAVTTHLLNGVLYPRLHERPSPQAPTFRLHPIAAGQPFAAAGYAVTAYPVRHGIPTHGYLVEDKARKSLFYSGDTGPGLDWPGLSPDLLVLEVTLPNRLEATCLEAGHLTPGLLARELAGFQKRRGRLPLTLVVHWNPQFEEELTREIGEVAASLGGAKLLLAQDGMRLAL